MKFSNYIGWDIGGAHLKIASMTSDGEIRFIKQHVTPLWQGLDKLTCTFLEILKNISHESSMHAVTMTAELVDIFKNRDEGTRQLSKLCQDYLGKQLNFYTSNRGFILPGDVEKNIVGIASANWHASASFTASVVQSGLFVDIGSTTTDIIPFNNGLLVHHGCDDQSRMRFDELVYTGIVRTPLMALAHKVPFKGYWQTIASENFATTADVYRILGLLNEADDLIQSADGRAKDKQHSMIRLARMLGTDAVNITNEYQWHALAVYFAELQIRILTDAVSRSISRMSGKQIKIVGAGAGRFLIKKIAGHLNYPYMEFNELLSCEDAQLQHMCNVCAPAVALAQLSRINSIQ